MIEIQDGLQFIAAYKMRIDIFMRNDVVFKKKAFHFGIDRVVYSFILMISNCDGEYVST